MYQFLNIDASNLDELGDGMVKLALTSPPYNIKTGYDAYEDEKSFEAYEAFMLKIFLEVGKKVQHNGFIAINVPEFLRRDGEVYFMPKIYERIMEQVGFHLYETIFWVKVDEQFKISPSNRWDARSLVGINDNIHSVTEWIMVFSKGAHSNTEPLGNVWFMGRHMEKAKHPAAWPNELPRRLIDEYSREGDLVLDPFMGIGTSGIEAIRSGRRFIGVDLSKNYIDVAEEEISKILKP